MSGGWDAEITEQKPDERVARRNTDGKDNAGVVTLHRVDDGTTRMMVQMDFVPEGVREKIGDALGAPDHRVQADRQRFKGLIGRSAIASSAARSRRHDRHAR